MDMDEEFHDEDIQAYFEEHNSEVHASAEDCEENTDVVDKENKTLEQAILNQIIYVQSICDVHGADVALQEFLMKQFIGGFTSRQGVVAQEDFDQQPLVLLMSKLLEGWNGKLDGGV
jgi:hypothetical protein